VLYGLLKEIARRFRSGERDAASLIADGQQVVAGEPSVRLDYLEIVDPETLEPLPTVTRPALVAIAAFVGTTRLIDNVVLEA
jgi:pantothenate synthetase